MEKKSNSIIIGLVVLATAMIVLMFIAHMYMVFQGAASTDTDPADSIIQNLISMQSITLAITGISITVVSIVISLLTIFREKKISEANQLIEKLNKELESIKQTAEQQQEKSNDNLKKMINLLALQASEFSEQYFDNILNCIESIEVKELEDTIKTQMSFVMVNTIEKIYNVSNREARFRQKDSINMEAYQKIMLYSQYMLEDKHLNKELYEFATLKYIFYLYQLARLEERTDITQAQKHLAEAYDNISKLQKMKDTNGHIHHLCGMICLWLGKVDITLDNNQRLNLFTQSLEFLQRALTLDRNFIFLNTYAIVFMNIAYVYKKQGNTKLATEYLKTAEKELENTLRYNQDYHLPHNNLANTYRNLIELKIGINDFYREYPNISFAGLNAEDISQIQEHIQRGCAHLELSKKYEPNFIDNYYNLATFHLYRFLLGNKTEPEYAVKAREALEQAEKINPKARKMLLIKDIVYQLT